MSSSDKTVRRREIEDSTAARLAEIVGEAEKAARQVIDEAEEEARSRLIDAREEADRIVAERLAGLAELTDEISAQADALRRQSEALQQAIADAKAELAGGGAPAGTTPIGRRGSDRDDEPEAEARWAVGPSLTVVGSREEAKSEPEASSFDGTPTESATPAGARLLATQMAVSGSSRLEIEERLRNGFAIKDTGAILDAILGPEN